MTLVQEVVAFCSVWVAAAATADVAAAAAAVDNDAAGDADATDAFVAKAFAILGPADTPVLFSSVVASEPPLPRRTRRDSFFLVNFWHLPCRS